MKQKIVVGLASGIGNCAFMLPTVKAFKLMGHEVALFVEDDHSSVELWDRCLYADRVMQPGDSIVGYRPVCGFWRPPSWTYAADCLQYRVRHPHQESEVEVNLRLARDYGWEGNVPDCSDWCRELDRQPRWDVGIVAGCKPGPYWERKRYPGMALIAQRLLEVGVHVGVIHGRAQDDPEPIPGEQLSNIPLGALPDVLAGCRMIIGTDSGPTNLAISLGVPAVVIFTGSCETKARFGDSKQIFRTDLECRPCMGTPKWDKCRDWRCRDIDPDLVLAAAEEMLCAKCS